MMNPKNLFPVTMALIAFVITNCCLFAGTKPNVLDSVDLLRVRTRIVLSPGVGILASMSPTPSPVHQKARGVKLPATWKQNSLLRL